MPPIRYALALAFLLTTEPSFAATPAPASTAAKPAATAKPATTAKPAAVAKPATAPTAAKPPATRVEVVRDTYSNGTVIEDPYRWLEDKKSPETRAWIGAQQSYTRSVLDALPGRPTLSARIEQYLRVDAVASPPKEGGGRYFYTKRLAKKDLPALMMRSGAPGKEVVLVDPDTMSKDHTVTVDLFDVSTDGKTIAYGIRRGGEDEVELVVFDVDARRVLPDRLPRARYFGISLQPDHNGFYYAHYGAEGSRIYHHTMGAAPSTDELIFGDGYGPDKIAAGGLSDDGKWYLIVVYYGSAGKKTEVWLKDVAHAGPVVPVVNDVDAAFFPVLGDDRLYMRTDWQAPNGRIVSAEFEHPQRDAWHEVVPEGKDPMDSFAVVGGKLVVNYLHDVASNLKVYAADGKFERDVTMPTLGSVDQLDGRSSKAEAFFLFQSYHVPKTIVRLDPTTGKRDSWWRSGAPIQSDRYQVDQVWYPSKDKTKVPMFVLHRKGIALDGSHPTLLTGYGGFRASELPTFRTFLAMWVEMGGIVANPNLRGGGEFGEAWHEAGMLEKKQNVFDDFEAAAEWLIKNQYTSSDKLAIEGGSNGGLLVGAFFTQRPELCRAVLCQVPLLDMLRYQNFLVARFWVPEYGSAENAEQFPFLRAYSPYQNVKPSTQYPGILFVSGDSDTRVDPLHARKMTALMQTLATPDRPALLLYDTKIGHSGGKPIPQQVKDMTDELSFLAWQLGFTPTLEAPAAGAATVGAASAAHH